MLILLCPSSSVVECPAVTAFISRNRLVAGSNPASGVMLRVALIGAGNIKFHYFELLKIPEQEFNQQIEQIAKVLAESNVELVLLPDRGAPFEVAKRYKEFNGSRVYGTVPLLDKDFGIGHLQPYINAEQDGKKIFDEIIDTKTWYKQDVIICNFGDIILMLGNSLGSLGELAYAYYLYKLFYGEKPEIEVMKKKIDSQIRAGDNLPYSLIVYKPFMKENLNFEIEAYIKKLGGNVYYVNNPEELKSVLSNQKHFRR